LCWNTLAGRPKKDATTDDTAMDVEEDPANNEKDNASKSVKRTRAGRKKVKRAPKTTTETDDDGNNQTSKAKCLPVTMYIGESDVDIASGNKDDQSVYGDTNMFLFLRLHRFIYERLSIAKKLCSMPHNTPINRIKHPLDKKEDEKDGKKEGKKEDEKEAMDDELDNFTVFLSTLFAVVAGTCDNSRFEEHCRNLMGTGSFWLHSIEKLITQAVKTMVLFATHHTSKRVRALFDYESKRKTPSTRMYAADCAALIRNEVAEGYSSSLDMFSFCMKKGVPAEKAEEACKVNQEEEDDSDLLDLEALGIAPCPNAKDKDVKKPPAPKKCPFDIEHGWRVIPRLHIGYIPLKKEKIVNPTSLYIGEASEIGEHFQTVVEDTPEEKDDGDDGESAEESSD
jgi:hypothetical protein